ncbi:MAG: Fur family transcriptional regulator, stress-responsive regulator [Solirubrobacteraceae bacterium]|jgi:Fe2+ or Zn2+ uptake regulation protein|nr:Fur family transcriptional regulator, stress-responsive regulator [Solirubrobacteraceae bacterium]
MIRDTNAPSPLSDLSRLLHSRGQRATPQRYVILRELRRRGRHVTADELGQAVRRQLPGTSIPTVYATLELFVELGLARRIGTGLGPALYDARTEPHQHSVCRRCGRVDDVDGQVDTAPLLSAAGNAGFHPEGAELVISGVCAACAHSAAASSPQPAT